MGDRGAPNWYSVESGEGNPMTDVRKRFRVDRFSRRD